MQKTHSKITKQLSLQILCITFIGVGLFSSPALSQNQSEITVNYTFELNDSKKSTIDGFDLLSIKDTKPFGPIGAPELPSRQIRILLPYGHSVAKLNVTGTPKQLDRTYAIAPAQAGISNDNILKKADLFFDTDVYQMNAPYPANLCPNTSIQKMRGYTILLATIYPVQYNPSTGRVLFYKNLAVNIQLNPGDKKDALYRGLLKDKAEVQKFVDNPLAADSYPIIKPQNKGYDGVIITTQAMASAYQKLVDFKATLGLDLKIALVQDIYATMTGFSNPTKIRNYIIQEYTDNGIVYALIGGDVDAVPVAYFMSDTQPDNEHEISPSDLYYACFDGTFDEDGDQLLNEFMDDRDETEYVAEVYVGRIPSDTAAEATAVINKIISFESTPRPRKAVLHAAMMNDEDSSKDIKEGNSFTDDIGVHDYLPSDYEVITMYQPETTPTLNEYIAMWSSDTLFINHLGHGLETGYSIHRNTGGSGESFRSADAKALTNSVYPIHTSQSCLTGRFDYADSDCLAEELLLNPSGGSVANVQNSRNGYYGLENPIKLSGELDIAFYKAVFETGAPSIGHAVQFARQDYAEQARSSSQYAKIVARWNLLGDPTMKVLDGDISLTAAITSPNGGEQYLPESTQTIEWNTVGASGETSAKLEYSTEGKDGPWTLIVDDHTDDKSYQWQVPDIESDNCYIKITVTDSQDSAVDKSNDAFIISTEIDTDTGTDEDIDTDADDDDDDDNDDNDNDDNDNDNNDNDNNDNDNNDNDNNDDDNNNNDDNDNNNDNNNDNDDNNDVNNDNNDTDSAANDLENDNADPTCGCTTTGARRGGIILNFLRFF